MSFKYPSRDLLLLEFVIHTLSEACREFGLLPESLIALWRVPVPSKRTPAGGSLDHAINLGSTRDLT